MEQEIIYKKNNNGNLIYKNSKIRICLICGNNKIDSFEFGVSCEECGTLFGRSKC